MSWRRISSSLRIKRSSESKPLRFNSGSLLTTKQPPGLWFDQTKRNWCAGAVAGCQEENCRDSVLKERCEDNRPGPWNVPQGAKILLLTLKDTEFLLTEDDRDGPTGKESDCTLLGVQGAEAARTPGRAMVSTGHGASRMTCSAILPRRIFSTPRRAWVARTIQSACMS